ncbi:capsule assembly Wzi family protein [Mucilaginibacter sp. X4EP1]|uniref:capsule assembly Wzi family protein n=1 Tax=Mucilaginibacter sp. X4EP1 TaxID=2723092 RepID=UPI0021687A23|nr:capsule assembly Wzi family protein [Mucilaginibacter sp. X4EP1]MCS3812775.1 hypothetical protein [Mucilaginibacter sp. X4EP1]
MKNIYVLICLSVLLSVKCFSQTTPVGDYAETLARKNQLLGISDDLSSFCLRPVNSPFNSNGDSVLRNMVGSSNLVPHLKLFGSQVIIRALPFSWLSDYNSKLPYGYNNGPLYPNVGYQTMATGGIYVKAGILRVQFKPELVHAENSPFLTFANVQANYKSNLVPAFFSIINGIDAPERFGPYGISHADFGQSKITLVFKDIEAGVSSENIWWGPGVQNSIMMSNSAPGFLHWTINSANPIKSGIGSFEWQVIGGVLKQSGFLSYDPGKLVYDIGYYIPKPAISRYVSGFTANWQPKWIQGLYIGASGYDYRDMSSAFYATSFVKRVLPVFFPSTTTSNDLPSGDGQDFAYSTYVRQVLPKYNAEIYFEFARNDQAANVTDFFLEPEHSSAYTFGGSRLFPLSNQQYIQVKLELTHLQLPDTFLLRPEPTWYVHNGQAPADGYTNEGRYLGAGIGPGSNSLMLDISYTKNLNSFGIQLERYVHDNDLYYNAYADYTNGVKDRFGAQWVDLSNTFYANFKFKKYLISARVVPVFTFNYEYLPSNIFSLNARLNLTYYFD